MTRVRVSVRGVVQGVGFRPLVAREARARRLVGSVQNAGDGVEIEVQGEASAIDALVAALLASPAPARIDSLRTEVLSERADAGFRILASAAGRPTGPVLPADLAPCADCWREVFDPGNRRYHYPFTTCTRCGPRYSVVEALPYDRERTSLRHFALCAACRAEYEDPADRRYHAEALACPACGPTLSLLGARGALLDRGAAALAGAAGALRDGRIVAVLGLGGFQLLGSALDAAAVAELRRRKRREARPFAVMFRSLAELERHARVSPAEAALLASPEAPIVLLHPRDEGELAAGIAPGSPFFGAMLPSTPLHGLLLHELSGPLVCTSGNRSSEPLCTSVEEAVERLAGLADRFLVHDRPVVRPLDDSLARVTSRGREILRRARGYAPEVVARLADERPLLALGAHQKSTLALAQRGQVVLSQHLGDLGHPAALALFERTVEDLLAFFRVTPELVACDRHPDYASTRVAERLARRFGVELVRVQHHAAHVAAAVAEHALEGEVLGFCWDGTGLGTDGGIWGGEALLVAGSAVRRFAHLRPLPLLGGDAAAREPWRSALGALALLGDEELERAGGTWLSPDRLEVARRAFERGVNVTPCSSVGRLFDAVAGLVGLRARCSFEGQAALELEQCAAEGTSDAPYALPLSSGEPEVADPAPLLRGVLADVRAGVGRATVARRFHATLAAHAREVAERAGRERVVLTGGCFQNERLERLVRQALEAAGFRVYGARGVPCNDAGIAVGQLALAALGTAS